MSELSRLALIALGCNQRSVWGDAASTVQKSISLVAKLSRSAVSVSGLKATAAFPAGSGPDYVNAAMVITTALAPDVLLQELHRIEAAAGRERGVRWGQRTLDLDLLGMDDVVAPDVATYSRWRDLPLDEQQRIAPDQLILPHPRLQDRAFVLVPLAQVAPGWVHPVLGLTVQQMCDALPQADRDAVLALAE